MEVSRLVKRYLARGRMMQIATVDGDQPWVCTVYYVEDENQNLYWLSLPSRRHSREIAKHNKVAVALPIKFDKNPVIGLQAEGAASEVTDPPEVAKAMKAYVKKYAIGQKFYDNFMAGHNHHRLYKFTPSQYFLFDETNFSDGQKHAWAPEGNT